MQGKYENEKGGNGYVSDDQKRRDRRTGRAHLLPFGKSALLRSSGRMNVSAPLQGAGIHIARAMVCCGASHRKRAAALSLPVAAIPNIV